VLLLLNENPTTPNLTMSSVLKCTICHAKYDWLSQKHLGFVLHHEPILPESLQIMLAFFNSFRLRFAVSFARNVQNRFLLVFL